MVKNLLKIIVIVITLIAYITLVSCEDVIDVDLETAAPRLVVEASIKWQKGTTGNNQSITLSTTAGFYENSVPIVQGATVFVTNEDNVVFDFIEIPSGGIYNCTNFIPEIDKSYTLTVLYNSETYTATEILKDVPTIDSVEQTEDGGFTGSEKEVKFFFQDNGLVANFYLEQYTSTFTTLPEYDVSRDFFFQGNQMFGLYTNEDMKADEELTFSLQGISENYYNYMNILLGVSGNNGGGPFQTPPATVRGNIVNQTNFNNFALGFFRLSEIDTFVYTVQ